MGILVSAAEAGALVHRHERMVRWHITERRDLPATKTKQGQWQINTDDLPRVRGWTVDRERLAQLELRQSRSAPGLVARAEALEQRMRALEAHIRSLEAQLAALGERPAPPATPQPTPERAPAPPEPPQEPDSGANDGSAGDPPADWWVDAGDLLSASHASRAASGMSGVIAESAVGYPSGYRGPATVTLLDRGPQMARTFRTRADAARWLERHGINEHTPKSWRGWAHVELTPLAVLSFALTLQRAARARGDWRVGWQLRRCQDETCVCQELLTMAAEA